MNKLSQRPPTGASTIHRRAIEQRVTNAWTALHGPSRVPYTDHDFATLRRVRRYVERSLARSICRPSRCTGTIRLFRARGRRTGRRTRLAKASPSSDGDGPSAAHAIATAIEIAGGVL